MIFIVDDNISNLMKAASILESDYEVVTMSSAAKMFSLLEKKHPELILLDIEMPEMNGFEAIVKLKENPEWRDIPVIFLTGRTDEEKGLSLGAVDYITKPYSPVIVKLRVQNQINILSERLYRVKSEFLSRMSHELLTPMNAIMGVIQSVDKTDNSEMLKKYLGKIENASSHMLELVQDLLDVSVLNEDKDKSLSEAAFSLSSMIENVLKTIKPINKKKEHTITTSICESIPDVLLGDEKRITRVITHLMTNAVKFTLERGEIDLNICTRYEEKEAVTLQFKVTDNGFGIPKERRNKLFEIFEQADGSATREHGGMGVGLALSKLIVEAMGGKIWFDTELGEGSKFIFTCKFKKQLQ
jgi:signal transduction histidine kinase